LPGIDCIIIVFFALCSHTVDLVFIYISELYNFSVIMEGKKSTARTIKIQWYDSCDRSRATYYLWWWWWLYLLYIIL